MREPKELAKAIFQLRKSIKTEQELEGSLKDQLRNMTDKVEGVCQFQAVERSSINWEAIAKALFAKHNYGRDKQSEMMSSNKKSVSYEQLVFDYSYTKGAI